MFDSQKQIWPVWLATEKKKHDIDSKLWILMKIYVILSVYFAIFPESTSKHCFRLPWLSKFGDAGYNFYIGN